MKVKVEKTKWKSYGIALDSGDSDYRGCKLVLQGFGNYVQVFLPQWVLRPVREFRDLSGYVGHPSYQWLKPNQDGTYGYTEVHSREYGFSWSDRALHIRYGKQTNEWPGCKSKCFFMPFLEWRHVRFSLLDLQGNRLWDEPTKGDFRARMAKREEAEKNTPTEVFAFDDFDGERLNVTCQVHEREWRLGTGWFKWLSLFAKAKIIRTLDLQFSGETGRRKGSWKGGTLGHSIEIGHGETPESAFRRYCAEHDMTFAGEVA